MTVTQTSVEHDISERESE